MKVFKLVIFMTLCMCASSSRFDSFPKFLGLSSIYAVNLVDSASTIIKYFSLKKPSNTNNIKPDFDSTLVDVLNRYNQMIKEKSFSKAIVFNLLISFGSIFLNLLCLRHQFKYRDHFIDILGTVIWIYIVTCSIISIVQTIYL